MNQELAAIKSEFDAFDHQQHDTEHFNTARHLADAYVAAHPDEFTDATGEKLGPMMADLKQALSVLKPVMDANPAHHTVRASMRLQAGLLSEGPLTVDECVAAVDVFRAAGMDDALWRVEAWLLHRFEPQNIVSDAPHRPAQVREVGAAFHVVDGLAVRKPTTKK